MNWWLWMSILKNKGLKSVRIWGLGGEIWKEKLIVFKDRMIKEES